MHRLTKSDIERTLLSGGSVNWTEPNGRNARLTLSDSRQRRLFAFLGATRVRIPTNLPEEFIAGLLAAYRATDDPASLHATGAAGIRGDSSWRLHSVETEGFGGLNLWGGPPFKHEFGGESLLLEGPNGSGKSSLIGAIIWALTGDRPRDQSKGVAAHGVQPVFGASNALLGQWPPIATYPSSQSGLKSSPRVRVLLEFRSSSGLSAQVERSLDGDKVNFRASPDLDAPLILIETGLLMPARLGAIRFDDGAVRLTEAVQKLTGLDDLIAIGVLVEGLCHKSREYLSHRKKELATSRGEFDASIQNARHILSEIELQVPDFSPKDTGDPEGELARFGRRLGEQAAALTEIVGSDLNPNLKLTSHSVQNDIVVAIGSAREDLASGLEGLFAWQRLEAIARDLDSDTVARLRDAISRAVRRADEALELRRRGTRDPKFRLKSVAAEWCTDHGIVRVTNCPLCEQSGVDGSFASELEELKAVGEAATRTFDSNVLSLMAELESVLPKIAKDTASEILQWDPRASLLKEIRTCFVSRERYTKILTRFASIVEGSLKDAPVDEPPSAVPRAQSENGLERLDERIAIVERLICLATWFRESSAGWLEWWSGVAGLTHSSLESQADASACHAAVQTKPSAQDPREGLGPHLARLSDAMQRARPYREAASELRGAWASGKIVREIGEELDAREAVAESLSPLKGLRPLGEAITRETIEGLSTRIESLLNQIHINEALKFGEARLQKKEGLVVHARLVSEFRIDATLVANTSWLRAILWAFIFALREEAVEQSKHDRLPLLVFDDPQSTFDAAHRHRWAQYIASLQSNGARAQVILTTHDEMFLDLIKVDGVFGREAMIVAPNAAVGHVALLEGRALDRLWRLAQQENNPQAGRNYMNAARIHVEGILKLMLRGEDAGVANFVLGDARAKLEQLSERSIAPWDRGEFDRVVRGLGKNDPAIKYMEMSHHSTSAHIGMEEAATVEQHWRKTLGPALDRAFRVAREHQILHGGLKALHAAPVTARLPEGHETVVRQISLRRLGRASALTDGRIADGLIDFSEFELKDHKKITLAKRSAFRLVASTLEPVARSGDLLLVIEAGEVCDNSLVIALTGEHIVVRRFETALNHSDVAVLASQAIHPGAIQPPIVAKKATLQTLKIVGVLYGESAPIRQEDPLAEVCDCGGEAAISALKKHALGLVEVVGDSAVPLALNGQYLIIGKAVTDSASVKAVDGKPVIAGDSSGGRYFKRLRIGADDLIVLESLDSGGDYPPVILSTSNRHRTYLEKIWPVVGVLFELPGG